MKMKTLAVWGMIGVALAADLENTKWKLVQAGPGATVGFKNGSYHLKVCNGISGGFRIDAGKLIGEPGISTMMACADDVMKLEKELTTLFASSQPFRVAGNQLTVGALKFERVAIASKEAVTRFIYVASETKDCTGVARMKCLQIRENKAEPWRLHYSGIVGFEPVPGIEYRLRIKEDKVARPPADGSNVVWYLDMVVEQTVVDRAAADAWHAAKKR